MLLFEKSYRRIYYIRIMYNSMLGEISMDVGLRVKQLRKLNNMTTKELSSLCGVSQSTISKLENGNRIPDIPIIEKICNALNMTLVEFFMTEKLSEPLDENMITLIYLAKHLKDDQLEKLCDFIKTIIDEDKVVESKLQVRKMKNIS